MDWAFQSLLARFWLKVDKGVGKNSCWNWTGTKVGGGYGRLVINGKPVLAHRFSYELENGRLLDIGTHALVVRHKCDNRACVNPAHLVVGPQKANVADMVERGRHRPGRMPGEAHPNRILTDEIAAAIKADNRPHSDVAKQHGVSVALVHYVRNAGWSHLDAGTAYEDGRKRTSKGDRNPNARLTADDVRAIRASSEKPGVLARVYNILPDYVTMIRKRKAWKHIE